MTSRRDRSCCCGSFPSDGQAAGCAVDGDETYSGCSDEYRIQWGSIFGGPFSLDISGGVGPDCCTGAWSINKGSVEVERLTTSGCQSFPSFAGPSQWLPKKIGSYTECGSGGASTLTWYRPAVASGSLVTKYDGGTCVQEASCDEKPVPCGCASCNADPGSPALLPGNIYFMLVRLSCGAEPSGGKRFYINMYWSTGLCLNGSGADCTGTANCGGGIPDLWDPTASNNATTEQFCNCAANESVKFPNQPQCNCNQGARSAYLFFRTAVLTGNPNLDCPGGLTFEPYSWSWSGDVSGAIAVVPI